jgi:acyl-CoA thioesterase I
MENGTPTGQSRSGGRLGRAAAALLALCMCLFIIPDAAMARTIKLVALGDSLTAGYGLQPGQGFPAVLQKALRGKGRDVSVADAGVSGDTTAGGVQRLDWAVPDGTDGVILELGANDALRGLDPAGARKNLAAMLDRLKARNIPVLLAGMYAPRNLGPGYHEAFDAIYPDLAKQYGLILYPFFLDGVVGQARLNLPDGIHPTAEGVQIIVDRMLPTVERFIDQVQRGS